MIGPDGVQLTFAVQIDWLSLAVAHDAEASVGDVGREGETG